MTINFKAGMSFLFKIQSSWKHGKLDGKISLVNFYDH